MCVFRRVTRIWRVIAEHRARRRDNKQKKRLTEPEEPRVRALAESSDISESKHLRVVQHEIKPLMCVEHQDWRIGVVLSELLHAREELGVVLDDVGFLELRVAGG